MPRALHSLPRTSTVKGVFTTASGLQYMILRQGTGPRPKPSDRVKVNYHGTLLDGSVFDSSYDRGQPAEFALNQVIPGWTEGVGMMPVGGKYRFWIPGDLAYGAKGTAGQPIGPNATLVFDVELLPSCRNPVDTPPFELDNRIFASFTAAWLHARRCRPIADPECRSLSWSQFQ